MLNYGSEQSKDNIGLRLLKHAEKNIVIKSHMYEIGGLTPDDIAQELRMRIWNVRYSYVPKKSSMKTFVDFVVKNYLKDLYKRSKRKKQFLNESKSFDQLSIKEMAYIQDDKEESDRLEEWRKKQIEKK